MSNIEKIKQLRELTCAGMKDCKEALVKTNWDLDKAIDVIKEQNKNISSGKHIAAEGHVESVVFDEYHAGGMIEVNCVTDFTAKSKEFKEYVSFVMGDMRNAWKDGTIVDWSPSTNPLVVDMQKQLQGSTKEKIEVRRWWVEELASPGRIFTYSHPNVIDPKIGVLLSLGAETLEIAGSKEFMDLGIDLAMQVAAMSPVSVSPDRLPSDVFDRQVAIFDKQVKALNKPEAATKKIMDGKLAKWFKEVCLLDQDSVLMHKTQISKVIEKAEASLGGKVFVSNFIRCEVGEGIEVAKEDFAEEAEKMARGE